MFTTSASRDRVPLTLLVGELEDTFGVTCPLNTRQLRDLATNRKIPARKIDGQWSIDKADLTRVAEGIGMIHAPATAAA
jgi:hypothetical protein